MKIIKVFLLLFSIVLVFNTNCKKKSKNNLWWLLLLSGNSGVTGVGNNTNNSGEITGQIDTSFGSNGQSIIEFDSGSTTVKERVTDIVLQPDGKILLGGDCIDSTQDYCIARIDAQGALDNSFGTSGKLKYDCVFNTNSDESYSLLLDNNTNSIFQSGICDNGTDTDFFVSKLDLNGNFDNNFSYDGKLNFNISDTIGYDSAYAIAVSGNFIILGGNCDDQFCLAKLYKTSGNFDSDFDRDGKLMYDMTGGIDEIRSIVIDNNSIFAAGRCNTYQQICIAKFDLTTGQIDTNFNSSKMPGKILEDILDHKNEGFSLVLQSDGKIIIGGKCKSSSSPYYEFCIARFNSDGSLDNTFGTGGKVHFSILPKDDNGLSVKLDSNGKILIGGHCVDSDDTVKFCLARLLPNGNLDPGFGNDGIKVQDISGYSRDYGYSLELQPDGKILLGGYCDNGSGTDADFCIVRFE